MGIAPYQSRAEEIRDLAEKIYAAVGPTELFPWANLTVDQRKTYFDAAMACIAHYEEQQNGKT